jgi:hypothetical protein
VTAIEPRSNCRRNLRKAGSSGGIDKAAPPQGNGSCACPKLEKLTSTPSTGALFLSRRDYAALSA